MAEYNGEEGVVQMHSGMIRAVLSCEKTYRDGALSMNTGRIMNEEIHD